MSYIDDNLIPGEQVVHRAHVHWAIFFVPAIVFIIGLIIAISVGVAIGGGGGAVLAFVILLLFSNPMLRAVITYRTTELGITSRRVIAKWGFVRRETRELYHRQVESLEVSQGIVARMFNAGNVSIRGTGTTHVGGRNGIPYISSPMEFRRNALETIDNSP